MQEGGINLPCILISLGGYLYPPNALASYRFLMLASLKAASAAANLKLFPEPGRGSHCMQQQEHKCILQELMQECSA